MDFYLGTFEYAASIFYSYGVGILMGILTLIPAICGCCLSCDGERQFRRKYRKTCEKNFALWGEVLTGFSLLVECYWFFLDSGILVAQCFGRKSCLLPFLCEGDDDFRPLHFRCVLCFIFDADDFYQLFGHHSIFSRKCSWLLLLLFLQSNR